MHQSKEVLSHNILATLTLEMSPPVPLHRPSDRFSVVSLNTSPAAMICDTIFVPESPCQFLTSLAWIPLLTLLVFGFIEIELCCISSQVTCVKAFISIHHILLNSLSATLGVGAFALTTWTSLFDKPYLSKKCCGWSTCFVTALMAIHLQVMISCSSHPSCQVEHRRKFHGFPSQIRRDSFLPKTRSRGVSSALDVRCSLRVSNKKSSVFSTFPTKDTLNTSKPQFCFASITISECVMFSLLLYRYLSNILVSCSSVTLSSKQN